MKAAVERSVSAPDIIIDWPGSIPEYRCVTARAVEWVVANIPVGDRYRSDSAADLMFMVRRRDEDALDRARAHGLVVDTNPATSARFFEAVVGKRLRAAREHRGFKAWEVAQHLGTTEGRVLAVEYGQDRFPGKDLIAVATLYETEVDILLNGSFEAVATSGAPAEVIAFSGHVGRNRR